MLYKNKNNRKVTKLPTAKLIEIAVAKYKNGHNLEILLCTKASPIFSVMNRDRLYYRFHAIRNR